MNPLPESMSQIPTLNAQENQEVFGQAYRAEEFFGAPQDVEWTYKDRSLVILQSRPITTLSSAKSEDNLDFLTQIETFILKFGDFSCAVTSGNQCAQNSEPLIKILLEMANHPPAPISQRESGKVEILKEKFLARFAGNQRTQAAELLDLARTSYQLRDDDGIYLGRIKAQFLAAIREARLRIENTGFHVFDSLY